MTLVETLVEAAAGADADAENLRGFGLGRSLRSKEDEDDDEVRVLCGMSEVDEEEMEKDLGEKWNLLKVDEVRRSRTNFWFGEGMRVKFEDAFTQVPTMVGLELMR